MQVKDKLLKKISWLLIFLIVASLSKSSFGDKKNLNLINYNEKLRGTSAFFIQTDGKTLEEGEVYVGVERIRIDYKKPEKISLVLSKNKSMYLNHDLKEAEFFNTNKSVIKIFFKILAGEDYFNNADIVYEKDKIIIKKQFEIEDIVYKTEVIYENNPIQLRKIKVIEDSQYFEIGFFNHKKFSEKNKKFFLLINPYQGN